MLFCPPADIFPPCYLDLCSHRHRYSMQSHPSDTARECFEQALASHDALMADAGIPIWVGAEPTFTDRHSEAPEWLMDALGDAKEQRARQMIAGLHANFGGGIVLRTLGKQYPKEPAPRWCFGYYYGRFGQPIWSGPPDPLLLQGKPGEGGNAALEPWLILADRLRRQGWAVASFTLPTFPTQRIIMRPDGVAPSDNFQVDARLARPSLHSQTIPAAGLRDELAEEGAFLLAMDWVVAAQEHRWLWLELPAFPKTELFLKFLAVLAQATQAAALDELIITGFPPPVDASVCWTTLTPDPAVVEVNMAPATDMTSFLRWHRMVFEIAEKAGLSPYRLHYNGHVAGSGGGGQITLGGPTPEQSPFLLYPQLLPNLIGYLNRHPALSYYFACDFLGSTSQSPRPDEGPLGHLRELELTLHLLKREVNPAPEIIWRSLAPFLTDVAGNTHRSEINIEKLWNPYLPNRGCLGLVEFRALQMPTTPAKATALATLLRTIVLMLIRTDLPPKLVRWGEALHDRFALPFFLRADLGTVFDELTNAGLPLGQPIIDVLLDDRNSIVADVEFQDCQLRIKHALEFWPLIGDAVSQEHEGSRIVDASTARLEVCLRSTTAEQLAAWCLTADGFQVPLHKTHDREGPARVCGLRYRRFKPWQGLHPTLNGHGPIQLVLSNKSYNGALKITLHEWQPQGGAYAGLPADLEEARRRRSERCIVEVLDEHPGGEPLLPTPHALTPFCMDLRWL